MRRSYKVAEKVRHILATNLLTHEDPVARTLALTKVTMSPDLRYAKVFWEQRFSTDAGANASRAIAQFLDDNTKKLRATLAEDLGTRFVPELSFERDRTNELRSETEELLRRAREKDGRSEEPVS